MSVERTSVGDPLAELERVNKMLNGDCSVAAFLHESSRLIEDVAAPDVPRPTNGLRQWG